MNVVAGVIRDRIRLWHYLPKRRRWCAKLAVEVYKGPVMKALRRNYGPKPVYNILEDVPTGLATFSWGEEGCRS